MKNVVAYIKKHGNKMVEVESYDTNSTSRRINIQRQNTQEFTQVIKTLSSCMYAKTEAKFEELYKDLWRQCADIVVYIDA